MVHCTFPTFDQPSESVTSFFALLSPFRPPVTSVKESSIGATGTVTFRDVVFQSADFAIDNQGRANFLEVQYSHGKTDRGIRSNSTASANVWYSVLNASSNVYFTTLNNDAARPFRIIASQSGGSNSGNSVKTVSALLS